MLPSLVTRSRTFCFLHNTHRSSCEGGEGFGGIEMGRLGQGGAGRVHRVLDSAPCERILPPGDEARAGVEPQHDQRAEEAEEGLLHRNGAYPRWAPRLRARRKAWRGKSGDGGRAVEARAGATSWLARGAIGCET